MFVWSRHFCQKVLWNAPSHARNSQLSVNTVYIFIPYLHPDYSVINVNITEYCSSVTLNTGW